MLNIRDKGESVKISDFVQFVTLEAASKLNDPIYGKPAITTNSQSSKPRRTKPQNSQKFIVHNLVIAVLQPILRHNRSNELIRTVHAVQVQVTR